VRCKEKGDIKKRELYRKVRCIFRKVKCKVKKSEVLRKVRCKEK